MAKRCLALLQKMDEVPPRESDHTGNSKPCSDELRNWLVDRKLTRLPNNHTRGHMADDLARYFFAA